MAPSQAAVERIRALLLALGIDDDASIRHLALNEAELRVVAPEVIGLRFASRRREVWNHRILKEPKICEKIGFGPQGKKRKNTEKV